MDISSKVFIVTGGASGLGEGAARMLTAQGGKVVIADLPLEKGEALAHELGTIFAKCDVSHAQWRGDTPGTALTEAS